jgi:hypothetical protein
MDIATMNLSINQGTTFRQQLVWKSGTPLTLVDLTGCQAKLQVKSSSSSSVVLLELSTANGRITLGGIAGTIDFFVSAADSAALSFTFAVYDLQITLSSGDITKVVKGSFTILQGITK